MKKRSKFKIGQLVKHQPKETGISNWREPDKVLRIAKRELRHRDMWGRCIANKYFVVGRGDKAGYGSWISEDSLRALSPLELLAMQLG